jgi:hypothetical protein
MKKTDKQLLKEIFERAGYATKEFAIFDQKTIIFDNEHGETLHFDFNNQDELEDMGYLEKEEKQYG